MRVVVTGGTGLIGRQLVADLHARGDEVVSLLRADLEVAGGALSVAESARRIEQLVARADAVVHLAAQRVVDDFGRALEVNVGLSRAVAAAARDAGVPHLVYASTISVYDRREPLPWAETAHVEPATAYGLTKFFGELACLNLSRPGFTVTVLRLGHVFGADEHNQYMVNLFIADAAAGRLPVVNAPSRARRQFLYVKDASRSFLAALDARAAGTFNIGGSPPATNSEVAVAVRDAFGLQGAVEPAEPGGEEGIEPSAMDSTRARATLGFEPEFTLEAAMADIAAVARESR